MKKTKFFVTFILIIFTSCSKTQLPEVTTWSKPQVKLLTINEISILPFSTNQNISNVQLAALDSKFKSIVGLRSSLNIKECNKYIDGNTLQDKAAQVIKTCGTQGVLYGLISKYSDKSVAFKIWLYSAKHRSVIWSGTYENSQPVLTDNIFGSGGQGLSYENEEKNIIKGFKQAINKLEKSRQSL